MCGRAQTQDFSVAVLSGLQGRMQQPLPWSAYSFSTCVAHAVYPPLYIAGPILPFNAFASQLQRSMLPALPQVRSFHTQVTGRQQTETMLFCKHPACHCVLHCMCPESCCGICRRASMAFGLWLHSPSWRP